MDPGPALLTAHVTAIRKSSLQQHNYKKRCIRRNPRPAELDRICTTFKAATFGSQALSSVTSGFPRANHLLLQEHIRRKSSCAVSFVAITSMWPENMLASHEALSRHASEEPTRKGGETAIT